MSRIRQLGWFAALAAAVFAAGPRANGQEPQPPVNIDFEEVVAAARNAGAHHGPGNNFRDFNEVTRQAEKTEGLFTLYKTGDHLYAEIRPDQFNQPLLTPVTIARGMAQAGMPVGDDDRVLIFRRVGERIQIVQRNIHYKAPAGTPIEKAVKQNFTDSVLMALPIVALNPMRGGAVLIDLSDVFMTDFAEIGMGSIDRSRSQWSKVKGFPNNMELELEATYTGGFRRMGSGRSGSGVGSAEYHPGAPLQHHEGPGHGLSAPDRRRSRGPLPERHQGFRDQRFGHELRPLHRSVAAREV